MLQFVAGNLLEAQTEALVNTVNCVGVAGRGVALQFREAFPDNHAAYVKACQHKIIQPGKMLTTQTGFVGNPSHIINFPTKRHWKGKSRLEDIDLGLPALIQEIKHHNIKSVALPALGCGLGGLAWDDVRPRIEAAFLTMPEVRVLVYLPNQTPEVIKHSSAPIMTVGRAALVGLMHQYLRGLLDPFVTLLEVHKLMYFLQVSGEDLRLRYQKAHFGPYADNLRHVLKKIDGHFIYGYGDSGDLPDKPLELVPGALEDAMKILEQHAQTKQRFLQVSRLVGGFESPFGLELLSTVHWVAEQEHANTSETIIEKVYAWNDHKKQFSKAQILLAHNTLQHQNWLPALKT